MEQVSKIKLKYNEYIEELKFRTQPILIYWLRLTPREKQLITLGGIILITAAILLIINFAIKLQANLNTSFTNNQKLNLEAEILSKQYKDLTQVARNEFNKVSATIIKTDAIQVLDTKNPEVVLSDGVLALNIDNAKFDAIMAFLDQLRKSYGLFPSKLKITRLSQSGYASFSASFVVEQ